MGLQTASINSSPKGDSYKRKVWAYTFPIRFPKKMNESHKYIVVVADSSALYNWEILKGFQYESSFSIHANLCGVAFISRLHTSLMNWENSSFIIIGINYLTIIGQATASLYQINIKGNHKIKTIE